MPTQLSPGVVTTEYDYTQIVPTVSTSAGAIAGIFNWGPVNELTLIDNQFKLANTFGQPTNLNPETFFTAYNFLSYGNTMYVVRSANTTGATPAISFNALGANSSVSNNIFTITSGNTNALTNGMYIAISSNSTIYPSGNNQSITVINSTAISTPSNTFQNAAVTFTFGNPGTAYNALAIQNGTLVVPSDLVSQVVSNTSHYYNISAPNYGTGLSNFDQNVIYVAKWPGSFGNSLRVSVCDSATAFGSNVQLVGYANDSSATATVSTGNLYYGIFSTSIGSNTATLVFPANNSVSNVILANVASTIANEFIVGDYIVAGNAATGYEYLSISNIGAVQQNSSAAYVNINFQDPFTLHTAYTVNGLSGVNGNTSSATIQRFWQYYNAVGTPPGQSNWVMVNGNTSANDLMHVVVVDENGSFTGVPGAILETYKNVSRAYDAQNPDGTGNYYASIINHNSQYIWWGNDRSGAKTANSFNITSSTNYNPGSYSLILGNDGYSEVNAPLSVLGSGYSLFANKENVTIDLVMQGRPSGGTVGLGSTSYQLANYILSNVVLQRKDCILFVSPDKGTMLNNAGQEALSILNWTNNLQSTSYVVVDTGYKYQYDQFNNVNRWIPLNGDIAGLCARTDQTNNAWWSPAGFTRGQINNSIKLAYNPTQTDRDLLFSNYINPVVTFPGRGTILYGDATFLGVSTAFSRINVRRLFIVLERAISKAAQNYLFEFNDAFTRAQFVNLVTPYLRSIQGLRGIYDFLVICDTTNNPPSVIDGNQFVGDIYIKPSRAIDFIQLNFIAVPTGVQFAQIVGSY